MKDDLKIFLKSGNSTVNSLIQEEKQPLSNVCEYDMACGCLRNEGVVHIIHPTHVIGHPFCSNMHTPLIMCALYLSSKLLENL